MHTHVDKYPIMHVGTIYYKNRTVTKKIRRHVTHFSSEELHKWNAKWHTLTNKITLEYENEEQNHNKEHKKRTVSDP